MTIQFTYQPGEKVSWLYKEQLGRSITGVVLDEPQIGGVCARIIATESKRDFRKIGQRYWIPFNLIIQEADGFFGSPSGMNREIR